MANYTLKLDGLRHFIDEVVLNNAEAGVERIGKEVAVSIRKNAPRSSRKSGKPVSFRYLQMPSAGELPTRWQTPSGAIQTATAMDVQNRLRVQPNGEIRQWKVEAYTTNRRGKEIVYPVSDVSFSKKTGKATTGKHLAESIEVYTGGSGDVVEATIVANRPYAFYVEKGLGKRATRSGPGRREMNRGFMERGLVEHAGDIEAGRIGKG